MTTDLTSELAARIADREAVAYEIRKILDPVRTRERELRTDLALTHHCCDRNDRPIVVRLDLSRSAKAQRNELRNELDRLRHHWRDTFSLQRDVNRELNNAKRMLDLITRDRLRKAERKRQLDLLDER